MASIKFALDKRKQKADGLMSVILRVSNNQTTTTIFTGVSCKEQQFSGGENPINRLHPSYKSLNDVLSKVYYKYNIALLKLEDEGRLSRMTATEIKNYIEGGKTDKSIPSFNDALARYIERTDADKSKWNYERTGRLLTEYTKKKTIHFDSIDREFLDRFSLWMKKTKQYSASTRSIYLRCIRAVFYYEITCKHISQDTNPFFGYKMPHERKEVVSLTEDVLKKIISIPLTNGEAKARDFFMLSFLFCGTNPTDLYNLPHSDGTISYIRQKIAFHCPTPIHYTIQPIAQELINTHKGKTHLLSFAEEYTSFETFYRFMEKCLKRVGEKVGHPTLKFYDARYTWASIACKIDISTAIIDRALGHIKFATLAEDRYIAFDWSKVDEANAKVIEYIYK